MDLESKRKADRWIRESVYSWRRFKLMLSNVANSISMVFLSNWAYIALTSFTSSVFWVVFCMFDQLLFFSPVVVFYLPDDAVVGFILSTIISTLLGMVVSMNLYLLRHSKRIRISTASLFSGSAIGVISSTCASCSSVGLLLVSTFGSIGIAASSFLSNYQIPLRLLSIVLLFWALYSISRNLTRGCTICKKFN
ncbi:MAG TPA: hypothetical protein VH500_03825 [Nitrososphaeraceae archaeon]